MANRYWISAVTEDFNDIANWSDSSGGLGGASVPTVGDVAIFDDADGDCTFDIAVDVDGITVTAGYVGTLDAATNDLAVTIGTSGLALAGTAAVLMGDGAWDIDGNISVAATITLTKGTGTITLSGATATVDFADNLLSDVVINANAQVKQLTGGFTADSLTVTDGTLDLNSQDFGLDASGTIANSGLITAVGDEVLTNITGVTAVAGEVEYTGAGIYTSLILGNAYYDLTFSGAGSYQPAANVTVARDFDNSTAEIDNSVNNPDWDITGDTSNMGTWVKGTGTITLGDNGAVTDTINFNSLNIEDVVIDATGIKQLTDGFTTDSLTLTAGELDVNDQDIGIVGAVSVAGTWTKGAGIITLMDNGVTTDAIDFNASSIEDLEIDATGIKQLDAGFITDSLTLTNGELAMNDQNITILGNIEVSATSTWTKGTGTITLGDNSATSNTIDFYDSAIEDLVIAGNAGDTKQFTDGFTTDSLTHTTGILDINGQDIAVAGAFNIANTANVLGSGLNGSAIEIGASSTWNGSLGDLLDLVGTASWTINVLNDSLICTYVDVAYSDASLGNTVVAQDTTSTDSGDNFNWLFTAFHQAKENNAFNTGFQS